MRYGGQSIKVGRCQKALRGGERNRGPRTPGPARKGLTALALFGLVSLVSCKGGPATAPGDAAGHDTAGSAAATTPTPAASQQGPGEARSSQDTSGAVLPSASRDQGSTVAGVLPGIQASTRRSAAGLAEPLPDYPSWPLRTPAAPPANAGQSPHLAERAGYAYVPSPRPGTDSAGPQPGTIHVLEEKPAGTDFISQVSTLTLDISGWKAALFTRKGAQDPFAAADTSGCKGCHSS